jgi:tetratricopeptide (TPR) repeat protein
MALERGLLFEARGESDRAVEYYTQALAEDPENPELLLRLGAAQVGAGDIDAAEESLTRVQTMLPASAEAEHFVGRIAFARHNYAEAVSHFERAISLDASRGEFFVYAAWAALETNDIGDARSHAEAAIARDPSLGDAYWIRGAVRRRSGQARDAVVDLNRALTLRPTRYEALFELALCYDELRQLPQAIDALNRAVTAVDTNGEWWYRLGRLNMDADHAAEGARTLGRATLIGEATTPSPFWLADAHRILGDAQRLLGDRAGAVEHYRRYLELAPPNAVDRREVRSALLDLGSVPPEE